MPQNISLALASKVIKMMAALNDADKNKFISITHPSQPLTFDFADFTFFDNENKIPALELESNKSEFSTLVNNIPQDSIVYQPVTLDSLWNEFRDILVYKSKIAINQYTAEEITAIEEARATLSKYFANYKSYKNAVENCRMEFLNAKILVDTASGEESAILQKAWEEYNKDFLNDRIQLAEAELLSLGNKIQVEEAMQVLSNITKKSLIQGLYSELSTQLELSEVGDPSKGGISYAYTEYSPSGIFQPNSEGWIEFTLSSSEIIPLCNEAPEVLKSLFSEEESLENISQISFEFTTVSVVRPWFSEEFFKSDQWDWIDSKEPLVSDGSVPAQGIIPAFISKLLCIRKIYITYKKKSSEKKFSLFNLFSKRKLKTSGAQKDSKVHSEIKNIRMSSIRTIQPGARPLVNLGKMSTAQNLVKSNQKYRANFNGSQFLKLSTLKNAGKPANALNKERSKIQEVNIAKIIKTTPLVNKAALKSDELEKTEVISLNGIRIIGFECRRLPNSPNPRPGLEFL